MNIHWFYNIITGLNNVSMCYRHSNYFRYLNVKVYRLIFIIFLKMQMVFYSYSSLNEFSLIKKMYHFVLLIFMILKLLLSILSTKKIYLSMISMPVFKQLHYIIKLFLNTCGYCEKKSFLSHTNCFIEYCCQR